MAIYEVKTKNHWQAVVTVCVNGGEQDAVDCMKNDMEMMGYTGVEAVAIRRMNESYGCGAYGLIAIEDFHEVQ